MGFREWFMRRTQANRTSAPSDLSTLVHHFPFVVIDEYGTPPEGWYQRRNWNNKSWVSYGGRRRNTDWRWADEEEDIHLAGLSFGTRSSDFLQLAQTEDFHLTCVEEPDNPVNPHARKILASGTLQGTLRICQVGYLPDALATKYAGVEVAVCPRSMFLPPHTDRNLGVKIGLLVRSARYLKRQQHGGEPSA